MTDSFLTVEDINSNLYKYGNVNTLHSIDTSKIGTDEYEDVMYDFCICNHTVNGNNHTFTFNVRNDLWCGGYYFTDKNGNYLSNNASQNNKVITFTTTEESVILVLYLTNLYTTFNFERLTWISEDLKNVNLFYNHLEEPTFEITKLDGSTATGSVTFTYNSSSVTSSISNQKAEYNLVDGSTYFNGIVKVIYDSCTYYIKANFIKNIVPILIKDTVIATKVNTVNLTIPAGFTGLETATVFYNGNDIPVDFTNNTFELDLTGKMNNKDVLIQLKVDETSTVMEHTYNYSIPCEFCKVNSANDLYTELNAETGSRIIELVDDITLTSNISISHDAKIIGANHTIDLDGYSFVISEAVTLKAENVLFNTGNPVFIQEVDSSLTVNHCTFTNCTSEDYNNLGSVVLCDIDLESLNVDNDFTTVIKNSHFHNNHSCILHGGQLSVDNCTFHNTDIDYIDKNNVAFLHQTDGEALLTNNVFDIDYDTDELCSNEKNIGSAQAIFKCGIDAQVNTATHEYLASDEKALFCDAPYNNICHLFAKYYYPEIESCVYSSPVLSRENKALCYMISDVNWVFKENVQVTRVDSDSQNERRYIDWEDE